MKIYAMTCSDCLELIGFGDWLVPFKLCVPCAKLKLDLSDFRHLLEEEG